MASGSLLGTIGRKLTLTFAGIAALFAVVCVVSYHSVGTLSSNAGMVEHTYKVLAQVAALQSSLKDAETGQRGYLITGADAYLAPYRQALTDIAAEQGQLRSLTADNPRQQQRLDRLGPLVQGKLDELKETIDLRTASGFETARAVVLTNKGKAVMDSIRTLLTDIDHEERSLLTTRAAAMSSAETQAKLVAVLGAVLLLAGMAVVGSVLTRQIGSRIGRIKSAIAALARGDFTGRTELSSQDELGAMARDLDRAVDAVRTTVADVATTATSLSAAAGTLSGISGDLHASAEQASGKATYAAASADTINTSVQSVASGAEEMTASIREIASTSTQAAQVAQESLELARDTNGQLSTLGQASNEIGTVVQLITSIAEQTNLLALNATIEAARAGDAGKGFAVVASEVKDLAQETARATEDITRRIAAIQSSSGSAGSAVQRIESVIGQLTEFSTTIAAAVEQQSATTNEMTRSISDAARGTGEVQTNFAAVAEVTDATASSARSSQQAADDLSTLAVKLNQLVAKFTY